MAKPPAFLFKEKVMTKLARNGEIWGDGSGGYQLLTTSYVVGTTFTCIETTELWMNVQQQATTLPAAVILKYEFMVPGGSWETLDFSSREVVVTEQNVSISVVLPSGCDVRISALKSGGSADASLLITGTQRRTLGIGSPSFQLLGKLHDETEVIETHFHTPTMCFGDDGAGGVEQDGLTPWTLPTGTADVWGAEVEADLGGDGSQLIDISRFFITAVGDTGELYVVQIWYGTGTFAEAVAAGQMLTSFYHEKDSIFGSLVSTITTAPRIPNDYKIWGRAKSTNTTASSISGCIEAHSYPPGL